MKEFIEKFIINWWLNLREWFDKRELKYVLRNSGLGNLNNKFSIGRYWRIQIKKGGDLKVGANVSFRSHCSVLIYDKGKVVIGDNVFFNNYCSLNCVEKITIGDNTMFGESVKLYDHNHEYISDVDKTIIEKNKFKSSPISIGSNCWIGSNVTILKGVTIGCNVIIGAHNLVVRSIPDNTVVKFCCPS